MLSNKPLRVPFLGDFVYLFYHTVFNVQLLIALNNSSTSVCYAVDLSPYLLTFIAPNVQSLHVFFFQELHVPLIVYILT